MEYTVRPAIRLSFSTNVCEKTFVRCLSRARTRLAAPYERCEGIRGSPGRRVDVRPAETKIYPVPKYVGVCLANKIKESTLVHAIR